MASSKSWRCSMKRPTPITAIAVSTAKPIANPIRQPVGERRAQPSIGS